MSCCLRSLPHAAVEFGIPRSSRHSRRVQDTLTLHGKQVIPEVVTNITEKATLTVSYNGKTINNGEVLTPSETQVKIPFLFAFP